MIHVLIRTCERDDYISRLAKESFEDIYPDANITYLIEEGNYIYSNDCKQLIRPKADNFGGQLGVKALMESFRIYGNVNDNDIIIVSDSDIIVKNNFLKYFNHDHGGTGGYVNNLLHISGQMQILSSNFFNILKTHDNNIVDKYYPELTSVADDTYISLISDKLKLKKILLDGWIHHKFYNYNGNINFKKIINEIKQIY